MFGVTLFVWPILPEVLSSPRSRDVVGIFAAVTLSSVSFVPAMPVATLSSVTAASAIFAVVTAARLILSSVTALFAISALSTEFEASSVLVIEFSSM